MSKPKVNSNKNINAKLRTIPIREGKPEKCIACGKTLHKKSEYYCSKKCEAIYKDQAQGEIPFFLSKCVVMGQVYF